MESVEFLVQGSAPAPYMVTFWREGDNLRSSCTCPAGIRARGLACKHRIGLLDGDVTNLVSGNVSELGALRELCRGTDLEAAQQAVDAAQGVVSPRERMLALVPPGRRKSVPPDVVIAALRAGGLVKGNTSYFDGYTAELTYVGSVKVRFGTVFTQVPESYFPDARLVRKCVTDRLMHDTSQSVYVTVDGCALMQELLGESEQAKALRKLKQAIVD